MLRTLTCVTLGMTVMNSFTNEISHLLKKKGWEMFTFTSLIPRPCYPQTKCSCSLSHTPVCAPKCFILSPRKVTKVVHPY